MIRRKIVRFDGVTVHKLRVELCRMNRIRPIVSSYCDHEKYTQMRLALALRVVKTRPEAFVNNRRMCQAVLDKIDELFLARG